MHRWCNEVVKYYTNEPGFFGSKIAFTAKGKGTSAIFAMDFDGANAYSVSHNSSTNILPAWSPNGGQIAYTSFMRNNPDLYVAARGRRPAEEAVARRGHEHRRGVVARRLQDRADAVEGRQPRDLHHQRERRLGHQAAHERQGDRHVAGVVAGRRPDRVRLDRNGGPQIFVVPAGGGRAKQVSFNGSYNTTPTWSPKAGKHIIAYTTRDGGTYDIVTLDLDTQGR